MVFNGEQIINTPLVLIMPILVLWQKLLILTGLLLSPITDFKAITAVLVVVIK
jgi:hypothetical protein